MRDYEDGDLPKLAGQAVYRSSGALDTAQSDYLGFTIVISKNTSVPLYCSSISDYGHKQVAPNGGAIIEVSFQEPRRN